MSRSLDYTGAFAGTICSAEQCLSCGRLNRFSKNHSQFEKSVTSETSVLSVVPLRV